MNNEGKLAANLYSKHQKLIAERYGDYGKGALSFYDLPQSMQEVWIETLKHAIVLTLSNLGDSLDDE